jgi:hypothetical protein
MELGDRSMEIETEVDIVQQQSELKISVDAFISAHLLKVKGPWGENITQSFRRVLLHLSLSAQRSQKNGEDVLQSVLLCQKKAQALFVELVSRAEKSSFKERGEWLVRANLLLGSLDERQYESAYFFNELKKQEISVGEKVKRVCGNVRIHFYNVFHESNPQKFLDELARDQWNKEVESVVYPEKDEQDRRILERIKSLQVMFDVLNQALDMAASQKNEEEVWRLFKEINSLKVELLVQKSLIRKKTWNKEDEVLARGKALKKEGARRVLLRRKIESNRNDGGLHGDSFA